MPIYRCNGCHPEYPCILIAEGEFPSPDKCPWGLNDRCKWIEVDGLQRLGKIGSDG